MKELSIKEKAKAYDEAYKVAENIHRFSSDIAEIKRMEEIFPELKESEDEKVRRLLREIVLQWKNGHQAWCSDDKEIDTILAWLEKHGEGIDYDNKEYWRGYREGKQEILDKYAELEKQGKNNIGISKSTKQKLEDNLNKALEKETAKSWNEFLEKQGEQKPAWSEEDESILNGILDCYKSMDIKWRNWLKDLKDRVQPQPKQEWSEEEIENCAKEAEDNNCIILAKHIRQLKSLRPKKHKED